MNIITISIVVMTLILSFTGICVFIWSITNTRKKHSEEFSNKRKEINRIRDEIIITYRKEGYVSDEIVEKIKEVLTDGNNNTS